MSKNFWKTHTFPLLVEAGDIHTVAMGYLFNLVHFSTGDYPGKLTQREIISEEVLSEHIDYLSE